MSYYYVTKLCCFPALDATTKGSRYINSCLRYNTRCFYLALFMSCVTLRRRKFPLFQTVVTRDFQIYAHFLIKCCQSFFHLALSSVSFPFFSSTFLVRCNLVLPCSSQFAFFFFSFKKKKIQLGGGTRSFYCSAISRI